MEVEKLEDGKGPPGPTKNHQKSVENFYFYFYNF